MPFTEFPRTVQVNIRYELFAQDMENVYYFRKPLAEWLQSEAEILAEDLNTWVSTNFAPCLASDATVHEIYVVDLSDQNSWYVPFSTSVAGTVAQDPLPTSVATVVTWQTNQRGRSYRGRSYWGAVPKTFVDNSLLTSGAVTAYAAAATALLAIDGGIGAEMVVASRVQNGVVLGTGVTTSVTDYRVNTVPADQRRRRIGTGA